MDDQCKAKVKPAGAWHASQCSRKAVNDGYCKQHHPDTIAAKRKRQDEKWAAEDEAAKKHMALVSAATNPDNCIISRADLQGVVTLIEISLARSLTSRETDLMQRMEATLKESLEQ